MMPHNLSAATERGDGTTDGDIKISSRSDCGMHESEAAGEKIQLSVLTADEDCDADGIQYPSGVRFWLLMLNLGAIIILSGLDMMIVATAVPQITNHFHTVADVGWYSVAFRLCTCTFQFLYGKAYKLFSVKRVFLLANAFSFLGSLLCATAVSSSMLVTGRAVAGVGTAGLNAGAVLILVQSTPLRRRPFFLGLWAAVEGLSGIAGPLIGGALTQTIGWRWCFWINLPIGGLTLFLTLLLFSEAPKTLDVAGLSFVEKLLQLDFVSNLILVPALTCLFLALSWAGVRYPWHSGEVIGLLVTFGVLAIAFVYSLVRRGDVAALPIRIIKQRTVLASFVFVTLWNSAVAAIGAGVGTGACGYYVPFMIFASVTIPIAVGLATTFSSRTELAKLIVYTGLVGLGYGAGASGASTAVQTVLPDDDIPLGISVLLFGGGFGPAVTIATAQAIFANQLARNLHDLLPGVGHANIDTNGLDELVTSVPQGQSQQVILSINRSVVQTWYLVIALGCASLLGSLSVEWRSVKKENPNHDPKVEYPASGSAKEE
nr:efflux pump aflt [Quercus suber]